MECRAAAGLREFMTASYSSSRASSGGEGEPATVEWVQRWAALPEKEREGWRLFAASKAVEEKEADAWSG